MNYGDIMNFIPVVTSVSVICLGIVVLQMGRTVTRLVERVSRCEGELAAIRRPRTHPAGSALRDPA